MRRGPGVGAVAEQVQQQEVPRPAPGLQGGAGVRLKYRGKFPASGEINRKVADVKAMIARVEAAYAPQADAIDRTDGISLDFGRWRFNLRGSNTEPVLRLNVESRGDAALMQARTDEILALIDAG